MGVRPSWQVKNATFGDHRHCGSDHITYFVCHITLQDHLIKGFCGYIEGSSSLNVTTL